MKAYKWRLANILPEGELDTDCVWIRFDEVKFTLTGEMEELEKAAALAKHGSTALVSWGGMKLDEFEVAALRKEIGGSRW